MPFLIFWSRSFAVQYGDHFRSGIICGPIWGSFAVRDHLRSWDHLRTRTVPLFMIDVHKQKNVFIRQRTYDRKLIAVDWVNGYLGDLMFCISLRIKRDKNKNKCVTSILLKLWFLVFRIWPKSYNSFETPKFSFFSFIKFSKGKSHLLTT